MKRFIVLVLAVLILAIAVPAWAVQMTVNSQPIYPDVPPQNISGRIMIPARAMAEALGASVQWDAATQTVIVTTNNRAIPTQLLPLQPGYINLMVNGQYLNPDVPPQNIGGRVLVPARALAEALGASVDWDAATQTVIVTASSNTIVQPTVQADQAVQQTDNKQAIDKINKLYEFQRNQVEDTYNSKKAILDVQKKQAIGDSNSKNARFGQGAIAHGKTEVENTFKPYYMDLDGWHDSELKRIDFEKKTALDEMQ